MRAGEASGDVPRWLAVGTGSVMIARKRSGAAGKGFARPLRPARFGSPDLPEDFIGELVNAGVRFRIFDPGRRLFGQRLNVLRRMHRKIVVVDGEIGFIGRREENLRRSADTKPCDVGERRVGGEPPS